ncbi:MAG: hypothetical protein ACRDRU_08985 [Pseudonocardiaceae bacterium]
MQNPLHRLYRTKLALLATIFMVAGFALLFLAHWSHWAVLSKLPIGDVGSALFTTGLIVVAFEYVDSQDADERASQRLRSILKEQAPTIRDSVIEGFAVNPDILTRIASSHTLDHVIGNCLAVRLQDAHLADDVYTDLRQQVIGVQERRYDAQVYVTLTPWDKGPATGLGSMFVATVRWDYRTPALPKLLRFSSVSDHAEYRQLLRDPTSAEVWLFEPTTGLDITTPEVYQLVQCTINGQPQPIQSHYSDNAQLFTVTTDQPFTRPTGDTHVSYTHRTLITQHGHLLFLDFTKPTKGLNVEFTYGHCDIRHVNILDFITSAQQPRILRSPKTLPNPTISIGFDGWTFPRSGVAFTWVLDREVTNQPPTT